MILNAVAPGVMKTPVLAQAASARDPIRAKLLAGFASRHPSYAQSVGGACAHRGKRTLSPSRIRELTAIHVSYVGRPRTVPISGTEAAGQRPFECAQMALCLTHQAWAAWWLAIRSSADKCET